MTEYAAEPPGPRDETEPARLPTDPSDADVDGRDADSEVVPSGDGDGDLEDPDD